jgi:hypothetical protein
LITARDMMPVPAFATARSHEPAMAPTKADRRERFLQVTVWLTMLASCVAIIEPSPHDFLMGPLLLVCLIAGVKFERTFVPLLLLLLVWNIGGLLSLMNIASDPKAVQYTATSIYLSAAAIIFACLLARNTEDRLNALARGYIAAAFIAAITGMMGYFNIPRGAADLFTLYGRADGMFKDPNVFGPYLIWPALFISARMLAVRITLRGCFLICVIAGGLFLSFSRGAWMHFAVSAAIMVMLMFVTAPNQQARLRLIVIAAVGLFFLLALIGILLSIDSVRELFLNRANAINPYDVGQGGRFQLQELAIGQVLDFPNGMGPFEFARVFGLQQHNVYLQGFLVYGWVGGTAYILMLLVTMLVGLRSVLVATPWQLGAITAFGAFVGEVGEGMVIDTDHWRHFFLLLGMVWGFAAATRHHVQQERQAIPSPVYGGAT